MSWLNPPYVFAFHLSHHAQSHYQLFRLANADTPGYKARDLNFDAALHFATNTPPLRTTNHQHFAFPAAPGAPPFQFQRPELQPSLDGNSVDAHAERAAFGRAALEYRASVNFIEGKVHTLMTAITGQ